VLERAGVAQRPPGGQQLKARHENVTA
jgi:hypothetical protein